ncbi:acyl carrier protein [Jatrophihabitans sp.]|uniref:acyl carrier protein n=1 Tax=Jatrophihabitans sp. TaxID=1932789 RepID=UPI002EE56C14
MLSVLVDAVSEVCVHEVPAIHLTTEIAEIGLDSVQTLELVACLEERLGTRLPLEELAGVVTVGGLLAVAERRASSRVTT